LNTGYKEVYPEVIHRILWGSAASTLTRYPQPRNWALVADADFGKQAENAAK
jgi:hypothetical protein